VLVVISYCVILMSLGELGAIDPARVSIKLINSSAMPSDVLRSIVGRDSRESSNSSSSNPTNGPTAFTAPSPWTFSVWSFGIFLLHEHLIPALRAANGAGDVAAQDFSGIAIQEILKILSDSLRSEEGAGDSDEDGIEQHSGSLARGKSRSGRSLSGQTSDTPGQPRSQPMPERLAKTLRDLQLLEITEPFYNTKYNLAFPHRTYKPNIYQSSLTFASWISNWCLQLICCSTSHFEPIFRACRGALRHRPELGQFLLPYLIIDAIKSTSADAAAAPPTGVYDQVVAEMKGVLLMCLASDSELNAIEKALCMVHAPAAAAGGGGEQVGSGNGAGSGARGRREKELEEAGEVQVHMPSACRQLAVQSIFGLMDQFSCWSRESRGKQSAASGEGHGHALSWETSIRIINQMCSDIPSGLLGKAALSTRAYARSARYFEISARENFLLDRQSREAEAGAAPEDAKVAAMDPPVGLPGRAGRASAKSRSGGAGETASSASASSSLSPASRRVTKRRTHDGANGELPELSKELLDNLLTIFAHLDDSDALSGVQTSRHIHDINSDPWNRIVEFEQMEQWLDALREYDLLQLLACSERKETGGARIGRGGDLEGNLEDSAECSEECTANTEDFSQRESQSQLAAAGADPALEADSQEARDYYDAQDGWEEGYDEGGHAYSERAPRREQGSQHQVLLSYVERGKLKCLLEMGHTKLAFDEVGLCTVYYNSTQYISLLSYTTTSIFICLLFIFIFIYLYLFGVLMRYSGAE
jgi:hypothetical protein